KIDYAPTYHFYMYPAPGPMVQAPEAKNALAATIFEEHPPFTNNPGAAEFVQAFHERAAKAGLPYTGVEKSRLRRALMERLHEFSGARIVGERRMLLEDRRGQRILGFGCLHH